MTARNEVRPFRPAVVIGDAAHADSCKSLALSIGLASLSLSDPPAPGTLNQADLIIQADLGSLATVNHLRQLLSQSPHARLRVFLVEGGRRNRVARVQAEALGATQVMDSRKGAKELLKSDIVPRLQLPAKGPTLGNSVKDRSIAVAGAELARLFDGVLGDEPIDMPALTSASEQILAGIGESETASWLTTVREHHEGTFQHCLLVAGTAALYARHVGLAKGPATALLNAAMLHDIGKALIPLSILDKPARLTEDELQVVRRHPGDGYDYLVLQGVVPPVVLDAIRHHHEMLDGSGYPDGLKGKQIRPLVRVLTICDVFAALTERRPYKEINTPAEAISMLSGMARSGKVDGAVLASLADCFAVTIPQEMESAGNYRRA